MNHLSDNFTSKTFLIRLRVSTLVALAIATIMILFGNAPNSDLFSAYIDKITIYAFLTAVSIFLAVLLSDNELSAAHVVGIMAFLALPEEAMSLSLWGIFAGGVAGGIALYVRGRLQPIFYTREGWHHIIYSAGRVTISFAVAGQLYISAGGELPLSSADQQFSLTARLLLYCFVYITLYFSIFLLEVYTTGHSVAELIKNDIWRIVIVLILPIPFALLGAEVSTRLSTSSEIINWLGLMIIILGLYLLSYSEFRLRKQLNELRTVSIVTRAMRAHLNMDALLKTVYLQVSHLLDTNNFMVVLKNLDDDTLEFPLVMRIGQEDATSSEAREILYHDGLINYVITSEKPLLITDDVAEYAQQRGLKPPKETAYSWLGVPLTAGGQCFGAMIVTSTQLAKRFSRNDLRLLNIIAGSASIAIENARLYQQQTERVNQLATLNNIGALLTGTLSPDNVIDMVITSASAISQANAVSVYLFWDDAVSSMRTAGLSNAFGKESPLPFILQKQEIPLTERPAVAVPDLAQDNRQAPLLDLLKQENVKAFIELPLTTGETTYGVIVLYFTKQQQFNGEKLELYRSFATQAAQAIKNADVYTTTDKAFQRSVEQLLTLAGIGRLLTATIDLREIADLMLSHASEATHVTTGVIMFYDTDGALRVMAQRGYPDNSTSIESITQSGVGKKVIAQNDAQRVGDVKALSNFKPIVDTTRSQLGVPIRQGKKTLGYIILECANINGFSEEDSRFVEQIANQAVIAIDNARLFQDITEGRDRLQVILDAMEEAILLIDAGGKIALANPSLTMLNLEPQTLLERSLYELMQDTEMKIISKLGFESDSNLIELLDDLKTPNTWGNYTPTLFSLQNDVGTQHVQRYVIPVRGEKQNVIGALMVFYNKTEEQELENAREQLSRMIVHDLRSPLTAVTTSMKLLRDLTPKDSELYPLVDKTTDASRRAVRKLLARVDSLLDISKLESGRMHLETEIGEIATIADNVCVELSPLAHELEIELLSTINADLPLLDIDADKVERLLLNLVDNALKYSPSNKIVNISATAYEQNPDFIQIEVADQGPGIPDEYKENLFDQFMQVKGRKKIRRGVGLGLTFCKLVAEAHGGKIWIEDNDGGGSRFIFTLPIAKTNLLSLDEGERPIIEA